MTFRYIMFGCELMDYILEKKKKKIHKKIRQTEALLAELKSKLNE